MITAVDCTIVRTAKEFDSKYLVQYLSTPMYFKVVNSFLGGGTRQRISRRNLSGINIPIPSTLEEQKKIGDYFSNLDNLITLHQGDFFTMYETLIIQFTINVNKKITPLRVIKLSIGSISTINSLIICKSIKLQLVN